LIVYTATTPLVWFGKKPDVLLTSTTAEPENTPSVGPPGKMAMGWLVQV
jgi:hypothetical protein